MIEVNFEDNGQQSLAGFRLDKFELRNWGTFTKYIWSISPEGYNALLTGDIGSGKSTIVDALTTLLVRQDKIIFNKAAGAESKERTPYSYIRGAYKNAKSETSGKSQDVYLRDENDYSVLLGYFYNAGFDQHVTLAQVFWLRNSKPDKFFVIAQQQLSVKNDFSDFGSDISKLKKRLKQTSGVEVYETYNDYANKFRQYFGIRQAEALDLFYQTVSMKSVGNLTDFVRDQMLGKTNIQDKISELVRSYEELSKAHDAAQRARHQKEILEPLMTNIAQLDVVKEEIAQYHSALQEIPNWFSLQRIEVLKSVLRDQADKHFRNENAIRELEEDIRTSRENLRQLESQRDGMEVSQLLHQLESQLTFLNRERDLKENSANEYTNLCKKLALPAHLDEDTFYANIETVSQSIEAIQLQLTELSSGTAQAHVAMDKLQSAAVELEAEINSLKTRKTQIPERNLALRRLILNDLDQTEEEIPFAGELIRVKEDEKMWEGAIERRLHDFGLSILVPERHYKQFSQYVNDQHLNGKIVYLRIFETNRKANVDIRNNSVFGKVEIKSDTEFYDWIESELAERYNYVCCETLTEFHREPYALTKTGQIKAGKVKHEKNDIRDINDRRFYVLGWSNVEKLRTYQEELSAKDAEISTLENNIRTIAAEENQLSKKRDSLRDLSRFTSFNDINFKKTVVEIQQREEEKQRLEASSKELKDIQEKITTIDERIHQKDDKRTELYQEKGKLEDRVIQNALALRANIKNVFDREITTLDVEENIFRNLKNVVSQWQSVEIPPIKFLTITVGMVAEIKDRTSVESLTQEEQRLIKKINNPEGLLDKKKKVQGKLEKDIVLTMERYREQYQAETTDVDASIESVPEFNRMYEKLVLDDIPRHGERFKKLLKEGTINGILVFKNQLDSSDKEIERKITDINKHLVDIPYSPGTYIKITQEQVVNNDISDFKSNLKACLENIYGETDNYNESKFLQVKKLLDKFRGETEEDKRWTERVTDVRQWYAFGASERYQEDHKEKEYYSDSSGKSGGQKEKLAYTILASAIAFQFGLSWDESRSRSFRFVVIDEAFGRGSDESTRYGLKLFKKLNLQLLIVTPLQKINIIEDYINAVHFVSNVNGQNSVVRNITKEEYLAEKQKYFERAGQFSQ